ncbi:MAG TPA: hypothetical protein VIX41_11185 [Acidimicrobiales bacterium]
MREFHLCMDCRVDTALIGELYMVDDDVWHHATGSYDSGMLCIGCLEHRLGRQLEPGDFTAAPINWVPLHPGAVQSLRLRDRLRIDA